MITYLTPNEVALATRHHSETVTLALRLGELCGTQPKKNGRWLVNESCVDPWVRGETCGHKAPAKAAA